MRQQRVLVVDDDPAMAENVAEMISGALPVETEVVGRLSDALTRARQRRFDLVLSDVRLPDGDGTDLVEPLRAMWPHAEVVLITGDATVDSAIAAVRGGAFAFVLKPFVPTEMLEIARRALAQVELATDSERLRGELERSERRHRQVVEAVPALVLALDGSGRVALWNRRLEETTGFARQEMIGQIGEPILGAETVSPLPVKGGGEKLVRWEKARVISGTPGGEETWTYAVGVDVTVEQDMLRRTMRSERLAAVGTMAAGLAHEVRNPLNSALLQLQVLRRRLGRGDATPESIDPVAGLIEDEIRRLERLVSAFLSFARPRPLDLQPTVVEELCEEVLAFARPEAALARVELRLEAEGDNPYPRVQVDPERLRQVVHNLVRNGLDAMPGGGRLTVRVRHSAGEVEMDVVDTGVGFPDEAPVFDAFFTTKSNGTGLGLSIVHRIVSDHGGTVRVHSHPGDTCFTLSIPV